MSSELARSLALGALMAFVITGSAFAAVEESGAIVADEGQKVVKNFTALEVTGKANNFLGGDCGVFAGDKAEIKLAGERLHILRETTAEQDLLAVGMFAGNGSVTADVTNAVDVKVRSNAVSYGLLIGPYDVDEPVKAGICLGGVQADVNIDVISYAQSNGAAIAVYAWAAENGNADVTIDGKIIRLAAQDSFGIAFGVHAEDMAAVLIGNDDSEVEVKAELESVKSQEMGLARGVYASGDDAIVTIKGQKINIETNVNAEESYGDAVSVSANSGAIVTIGNERTEKVIVSASGDGMVFAQTLYVFNANLDVQGGEISLNANGYHAYGVYSESDVKKEPSNITIGSEKSIVDINAQGEGLAYGVVSGSEDNNASAVISGSSINVSAVSANEACGVVAEQGNITIGGADSEVRITSAINRADDDVAGMATSSTAVLSTYDADVIIGGGEINITAENDFGNAHTVEAGGGKITVGSESAQVAISASAGGERNDAYAVLSQALDEDSASKVEIQGNAINIAAAASDGNAYGAVALGEGSQLALGDGEGEVTISAQASGRTIGIYTEGSKATVNAGKLNIIADGNEKSSYGIMARSGSDVDIDAGNINVIANYTGLAAVGASSLALTGYTVVTADNAINVGSGAKLAINEDGRHSTVLQGDIVFGALEGGSSGDSTADVQIGLNGAASSWTGSSYNSGDREITGFALNINKGAAWNMTDDSFVNDLTLNGGVVNLQNGSAVVDNLQGSEGVVSVANAENKFTVTGSKAITKLTATTSQEYAESLASDNMADAAQSVVNQIVYEKATTTTQTAATDVYIPASSITGAYTAEVNADGKIVNGREAVNSANAGIGNLAGLALMAWRAENNDMNKRLGELRASEGEHGAWVRMTRGESKYKGVKNQYNTYQIGYDEKLSADKRWTLGAAFSYTDGESGLSFGSGENKHKGLALYGSYLGDDGSFIDLIAKYARLEHDFDIRGGAGSGDYDTNGYSVSAEYGKRFTQENGVWLEPQVELTYGHVSGAAYVSDKGIRVRQDAMDSVVGRLGLSVGKNIERGNIYARASYLYDFNGETDVQFNKNGIQRGFEQDLGGGWWEVGVGANLKLGKDTHFYVDVERTYGGDVSTPWQWNAGLRYSF